MNLRFRQVEIFWAVMTSGSTTAAATMLNTSQPTISRELGQFERLTQLKLFERQRGKLVPTEHGLMLFEEVKQNYVGLDRIRNAVASARTLRQGQVQLACLPAFSIALVPAACRNFRGRYPDASINVTPLESPELEESLSAQRYHLGITESHKAPLGTRIECLLNLDVVCVLPSNHELCSKQVLTPIDFDGQDFVYLSASDPYRAQVDSLFSNYGVQRRMAVETHSANAVCATVRLGGGVAVVNPLTALHYAGSGLEIRRISPSITYSVSVVRPAHKPLSSIVDPFVDALRESCDQMALSMSKVLSP